MSPKYDVIIIGSGIVGLATAYSLLSEKPELKIIILEKEKEVAHHQTGHNSGVIHSGLYYKPGSLKAINCIMGYKMLLDFCDKNSIKYDLCGKIVVATNTEETRQLTMLHDRGMKNGLQGIKKLSKEEIKEYEPHCTGIEGIFVPQTGIISYKDVSEVLLGEILKKGGEIKFGFKVTGIKFNSGICDVTSNDKSVESRLIINCAGLYSDKIAALNGNKIDTKIIPFRGEYYKIIPDRQYLVKNLIYPVPDPNFPFLGVHFTRMIQGGVEAGPNAVFAFKREGYKKTDINFGELIESLTWPGFIKVAIKYWQTGFGEFYRSFSKKAFTKALQKLVPEITENDLITGGSGVRAQACDRKGGLLDDFKIFETEGIIDILNAPSPAATSSLSIGKTVAELAIKRF